MGKKGGRGRRRLALAIAAFLVVLAFLIRRTGLTPTPGDAFDPSEYRDVPVLSTEAAAGHVGSRAVVCGAVVNSVFASGTRGQPTFLNLDRTFPDQPFDLVIWGRNRNAFPSPPEVAYQGEHVCAAGRITEHQGVPRIEVSSPSQIRIGPEGW